MNVKNNWVGIDYGSKLAGTTVICFLKNNKIHFLQSEKKKDADAFIKQFLSDNDYTQVFLDAPLSLPGAYFGKGEDYFYRQCDKETNAMSPMFLGGLTARAMRLEAEVPQCNFHESYPGYLIRKELDYAELYDKKSTYNSRLHNQLKKDYKIAFNRLPQNWHQLDALCCWLSGLRNRNMKSIAIGNKVEGQIII